MSDMSCLAEGLVVPADFAKTGLNLNEIVVGPTGCGKSFSNAYSRLLHTTESSVIVPIAKKGLKDKFIKMFKERGYEIVDLDFANPQKSKVGYDPLDTVISEEDIISLANNIIGGQTSRDQTGAIDPYWNDSAANVHAAEIAYVLEKQLMRGIRACYGDVIAFHKKAKVNERGGPNLDPLFDELEKKRPDSSAVRYWKSINNLANRTASCILSIISSAVGKFASESILQMSRKRDRINLKRIGEVKTAVFITTSPMDLTLKNYINVLYADLFKQLFELAESRTDGRLKVPVHIICDDFACGSRIEHFADYISIFRAAGISVTLLLQSESQLSSMYGENNATTIINNCDTYVYMGGTDLQTCRNISYRMNKPLHIVMQMPLERVVVFRRGNAPYEAKRYQIMDDTLYQRYLLENERVC